MSLNLARALYVVGLHSASHRKHLQKTNALTPVDFFLEFPIPPIFCLGDLKFCEQGMFNLPGHQLS